MTERPAFDTRLYLNLSPEEARIRMENETVGLLMEADKDQPPEKRMSHLKYESTEDGKDFKCCYEDENGEDKVVLERTLEAFHNHPVSKEIFTHFLEADQRLLGLWISGPRPGNNQPEGRINVYIGHKEDKGLDYFPIAVDQEVNWDDKEYLKIANNFSEQEFEDTDQLRSTPLYLSINKDDKPLEILAQCIDMSPRIWEEIASGRSREEMVRVRELTKPVVDRHFDRLMADVPYQERIRRAARFERDLSQATGRKIYGFGSGCGASNNELLKINSFGLTIGANGEASFKKELTGTYVKKCPYCGKQLNKYITQGYTCECGQKYLGVC